MAEETLLGRLADLLSLPASAALPAPNTRVSMSPSSGDAAQTPEPKSTGGLASVFKSLTGNRQSRSPHAQSPAAIAQQLTGTGGVSSTIFGGPAEFEQLYEQLKVGNPLSSRIATAEEIRHVVQDYPLRDITNIFKEGKDLIEPDKPLDARIAGFQLLTACVQNASSTDPERLAYFQVLTGPANPEDFHLQLASFVDLAKHGRDLTGFHYQAIPVLTSWLEKCFKATAVARSKAGRHGRPKGKSPLGEETNLSLLFTFIIDVIKFSFYVSNECVTSELIDVILYICLHTPIPNDLKACINIIDAISTYGEIPGDKLPDCVKVLCSIHCLVDHMEPEAWRSISNLCRSHNGQTTVRILMDILRDTPDGRENAKQNVREIRGALSVLQKLFAKNGEDEFPLVPFTLLIQALKNVTAIENAKVDTDVLKLVLSMFPEDVQAINKNVIDEDWTVMFDVVIKCSQRAIETADGHPVANISRIANSIAKDDSSEQSVPTGLSQALHSLIIRIEGLLTTFASDDFFQREDCIKFFVHTHTHLPKSCAKLVIDHFIEYRCCYPSDLNWIENIKTLFSAFFADRSQPTDIRLHALKAVTDVFKVVEMMDEHEDPDIVQMFVAAILDDIGDEKDIAVLEEAVAFSVVVVQNADDTLFDYVIGAVRASIASDRLQSPLGSPPGARQSLVSSNKPVPAITPSSTPSNVVTKGLVQMFMRAIDNSASKCLRIFQELLWIAKSHDCEIDARITAWKMLFRLRADSGNRIFLTLSTESEGLAASLYRTSGSLAKKQAADEASQQHRASRTDDTGSSRPSRSTSFGQGYYTARHPSRVGGSVSRALQRNHQMWMYPDPNPLPEEISGRMHSLLTSFNGIEDEHKLKRSDEGSTESDTGQVDEVDNDGTAPSRAKPTSVDVATYLEVVTRILQNGCDWEVYSFILVHLPSQLTNQAFFKSAVPQIKALREVICDRIKNNSFLEPPLSSGLRKADVAICLFQTLNMLISYHRHFSKTDQDDIVRTFLQGIGSTWERTAKCCIHALSICSHEIPGSTSKALVTILQKMSTIITQSHVAVHILEYLACLARMPDLYVNFREEEYRIVFAICFRYLQYVRDQPLKDVQQPRSSYPHARPPAPSVESRISESNFLPNTSDDLPQYVHALAYHVIIFWFLSLKLTDRSGQVGWIAKNLVASDINGKEKIDEQAQVTLDFMQRVTYADVDESAADPTFKPDRFGEILKKRWIVGQSIVTVEQATRGGWAQITKRQPSGTSCYIIREKFSKPPPHQSQIPTDAIRGARHSDDNVVLPSHLLVQLSASIPQVGESIRPIALPSDAIADRAIKSFDRNFTVDGHKVGVIYMGENQTQEAEILANVTGSTDYTYFLSRLGTLTKLQDANFNTQGLDRVGNADGKYAFCWRDRVTEIVFHVTTQMPTNLANDPQCIGKKRHIGNDFVNIIFNNSGLPFRFDTFPSEFNYVNIVITPESQASFIARRLPSDFDAHNPFYKVQVMSKPGFPEISPAAETKIMSLAALPGFIRLLALNASVFSLVWANTGGGEHISSWRNRLREINRLREKYRPKSTASNRPSPPGTSNGPPAHESRNVRDSLNSLRRASVANFLSNASEPSSQRSSVLSTAETEVGPGTTGESIVDSLDFSRWA